MSSVTFVQAKLGEIWRHLPVDEGVVSANVIYDLDGTNRGKIWGTLPADGAMTLAALTDVFLEKQEKEGHDKVKSYLEYLLKRAAKKSGLPLTTPGPAKESPSQTPAPSALPTQPQTAAPSALPTQPQTTASIVGSTGLGSAPTDQTVPKELKVLFLHGFGHNADIAEFMLTPLKAMVPPSIKIDVLQGFCQLNTEEDWAILELPDVNAKELAVIGREGAMELFSYWPNVLDDTSEKAIKKGKTTIKRRSDDDVMSAVQQVVCHISQQGGYDGIMGFSQGAKLASMVLESELQPETGRELKWCVMFGGDDTCLELKGSKSLAGVRIFSCAGRMDDEALRSNPPVCADFRKRGAEVCERVWEGVHEVPGDTDAGRAVLKDVMDFILQ